MGTRKRGVALLSAIAVVLITNTGCFCTTAVSGVGLEYPSLHANDVRVQPDGSLVVRAALTRPAWYRFGHYSEYLRYVHVPRAAVEKEIARCENEHAADQKRSQEWAAKTGRSFESTPLQRYRVRFACEVGPDSARMCPDTFRRRDARPSDLPADAVTSGLDSTSFSKVASYPREGRVLEMQVRVSLSPEDTVITRFWHYPAQLLLPAAVATDIATFPFVAAYFFLFFVPG